jgi:hypothetical protein
MRITKPELQVLIGELERQLAQATENGDLYVHVEVPDRGQIGAILLKNYRCQA